MSLLDLPDEVLEGVFENLSATDLESVTTAICWQGGESFWRRVCKREELKRIGDDDSWRNVFRRNLNWRTKRFKIREYKSDLQGEIKHLHGKNLMVKTKEDYSVWNIAKDLSFVQTIKGEVLLTTESKILVQSERTLVVYRKQSCRFQSIFTLNCPRFFRNNCSLSEDFLAILQNNLSLKIVNLHNFSVTNVTISCEKVKPMTIFIYGSVLNIVLLEGSSYKLRRYHLQKQEWLEHLTLFGGAASIEVPTVRVSEELVVAWSGLLEKSGITPLKIWNAAGEVLASLPLETEAPPGEQGRVLWLVVEGSHVIISTSVTRITIWSVSEEEHCRELPRKRDPLLPRVVSRNLLGLAYTHGLQILDFHRATYVYDITFLNTTSSVKLEVCFINEYFCLTWDELNQLLYIYDFS